MNLLKNKSFSFYFTACVAVVSIITSIVYACSYASTPRFMSWAGFTTVLVGAVLALACLVLSKFVKEDVAAGILVLANTIGLCLFIQYIYNYVVIVYVGIDIKTFSAEFIACAILFAVSLVSAVVAFFLPKGKETK